MQSLLIPKHPVMVPGGGSITMSLMQRQSGWNSDIQLRNSSTSLCSKAYISELPLKGGAGTYCTEAPCTEEFTQEILVHLLTEVARQGALDAVVIE